MHDVKAKVDAKKLTPQRGAKRRMAVKKMKARLNGGGGARRLGWAGCGGLAV